MSRLKPLTDLEENIQELLSGRAERRAILTTHQQQVVRIFDDGKKSDDTQMGTYSEEYIKRRLAKGLPSGKVILEFTGQMRNDYSLEFTKQPGGFSFFKNEANFKKMQWNETRYGTIFDLTPSEEALLDNLVTAEVNRILSE